jgi:hypothetical protein
VQVFALLKVRRIINHLNYLLYEVRLIKRKFNLKSGSGIKTAHCQFCKFRQSYIKAYSDSTDDDFYYRCKLHDIEVTLNHSCKQFEPDPSY